MWDSCEKLSELISTMQPKIKVSPLVRDADSCLVLSFPDHSKKVKLFLTKHSKSKKACDNCKAKLDKSTDVSCAIKFGIDWEEREPLAKRLLVCCGPCYKIMVYSELMTVYARDSLQVSSSDTLSNLVAHFLKLNKLKVSDIEVFNAAISMAVSLRTSLESLRVEFVFKPTEDLDALLTRLTSTAQ
jgi:hypothetical protein